MVITVPTVFGQFAGRDSSAGAFMLEIPDVTGLIGTGTSDLYLSTKSFSLTTDGIDVHGLVRDFGPIRHSLDVYSHRYEVANVSISLSNVPAFKEGLTSRTTDYSIGLDYVIRKNWGKEANIYWYPGGDANELADCLTIFTGRITNIIVAGEALTLLLDERETINHRVLPQRFITSDVINAKDLDFTQHGSVFVPVENRDMSAPLLYGDFSEGIDLIRDEGNVPMALVHNGYPLVFMIADHPVSSGNQMFFYLRALDAWAIASEGWEHWAEATTPFLNSGLLLVEPDNLEFYVILPPTRGLVTSTAEDANNETGPDAAWDDRSDTKVSVIANSTTEAIIEFEWTQTGSESNDYLNNPVAAIVDPALDANAAGVEYWISIPGGITTTTENVEIWSPATSAWLTVATNMVTTQQMNGINFYGGSPDGYNWISVTNGTFWHLGTGMANGDGSPFKMRLRFVGSGWTADSTVVAYVHEFRLRVRATLPREQIPVGMKGSRRGALTYGGYGQSNGDEYYPSRGTGSARPRGSDVQPPRLSTPARVPVQDPSYLDSIGFALWGRPYGAWIDDAARTSIYSEFDEIVRPSAIIESLLRDELGLGDSDIDVDSFDDAEAAVTNEARVHLPAGSAINSKDLIETICYEHGFYLFRCHDTGKIRIIDYLGTGTEIGTLAPSDLFGQVPDVRLDGYDVLTNDLTVFFRKFPETGSFFLTESVTDSSSITAYGTQPARLNLETMSTDSLTLPARFKNRLISSQYLLSRPHRFVTLHTIGNKWAHAELGDHFHLDNTLFDPLMMCMGDSWLNLELMIISKEMTERGVTFDTIIWAAPTL